MLLALRADEVQAQIAPASLRFGESAAAYVLGRERLMNLTTAILRLLQRPFARGGRLHLPQRLNPLGERQPPSLAKKPFRKLWEDNDSWQ